MRLWTLPLLFTFCIQNVHADELVSGSGSSVVPIEIPILEVPTVSPLMVRVNEVMWMGTDKSTADEWLELTAVPALTGAVITQPLSLAGWSLHIRKDTGESVIAQFGSGLTIQSGSYIVVSHYNAPQSRLKHEPIIAPSLTLPNTKLQIILRDPSGAVIDTVDDYIGVPFAGANPSGGTKASMERLFPRLSGTSVGSWRTATTARGWDGGGPIFGTPGYENGSVDPVDATPPPDVRDLRAFSVGNTVVGLWTPDASGDVERQTIDVLGEGGAMLGVHDLAASQSAWSAAYSGALMIRLQTWDAAGLFSTGSLISVQPLNKPIISELMPDPPDSDTREWIELHNSYDSVLDMRGWTMKSSSKIYVMPHHSGSILSPGGYLVLDNVQTGLGLPNAGGEVSLSVGGISVETLVYGSMPDGISAARLESDVTPQCLPTPLAANAFQSVTFKIDGLQPGDSQPSTLNLNVKAVSGSIAGATCRWDFGDGFTSDSCNPPSHAMKTEGSVSITVEILDYCGNTMIQTESIFVEGKTKSILNNKEDERCEPSVFSGVLITEFMAAPESGEEWIELYNTRGGPLSLCGWSLDDREGGSEPYSLEDETIGVEGYLMLPGGRTDIALNNDQDIVRLIGPLPEGGTGVIMSVPYQSAEEGLAIALREDGEWLSTSYVTPGSTNAFVQSSLVTQPAIITIESALPDPHGPDTGNEWIELRNMTHRPQWIDGWALETGSGKRMELPKMVFEKNELKKIRLPSPFSLKNAHASLSLLDEHSSIQSVLTWAKSEAGHWVTRRVLPEAIEADELTVVSPVEMVARFNTQDVLMNVHVAGLSIPTSPEFISINSENKNTISALIKNKKIELKSDSYKPVFYINVDGVDIAPVLLEAGMAYVTDEYDFARKGEYRIHETVARKQKLGIWKNQKFAEVVDAERLARMMDARVAQEGISIRSDTPDGIVKSGAVIRYLPSAPADLFIAYGTGRYIPFAGSTMINMDRTIRVKAVYKTAYDSQKSEFSTVATHEYTVLRDSYKPCIQISEIYPSSKSDEGEWIEIFNNCDEDVNLQGWTIDDAEDGGSKPVTFQKGLKLFPHQMVVLSGALLGDIAFNNGGDSVVIRTPRKSLSHAVDYPSLKKGRAYAYSINNFCLTDEPTPLSENTCFIRSAPKMASKIAEAIIGLRNLHKFLISNDTLKNTKIDQNFAYFEGLELINVSMEFVIFSTVKYALFAMALILLGMAWRWWKDSVE